MAAGGGGPPENATVEACIGMPPKINSQGFWSGGSPLKYSLSLLEMQILLLFSFTQALHFVVKRVGIPPLASQIITGMIFGPPLLTRIKQKVDLLPWYSEQALGTLLWFGYAMNGFISGVRMDVSMILKTGKKSFAIGVLALITPMIVGFPITLVLNKYMLGRKDMMDKNLEFTMTTQCLTPFLVISCLLSELKLLNSELGRLTLSSAMISEFLSVILLTVGNVATEVEPTSIKQIFSNLAMFAAFLLFVVFVLRPIFLWIVKQTPEGRPVKDSYVNYIMLGVLISGLFTDYLGHFVLFGLFLTGLAIPDGPPLGSALVQKFDVFVSGLLSPLFVTTSAMRTNVLAINPRDILVWANVFVILVAFFSKLAGCLLPSLCSGVPFKDALALALIMCSRGIVEMATYSFLRDKKKIDEETFALLMFSVLLVAIVIPNLVKYLYDPTRKYAGYQNRNISCLHPNSELRILACVHKPHNVTSITNLIEACNPSIQQPVAIYVLHLIELIGRASPIFISHQIQKKTISGSSSYSKDVISAFDHYTQSHENRSVDASIFTAVSPPISMHDDICTLALNKVTSLIVIPFHRKWSADGSIESEDYMIRNLNRSVLEMAPCSVAVLIDRSHRHFSTLLQISESSYANIAVLFIGGEDDREALAVANRIVKSRGSSASLTVVRFVALYNEDANRWDKVVDTEALKEIKNRAMGGDSQVEYVEKTVKDGPETTLFVRSLVNEFDLIMVGRRQEEMESPQTSGLSEWTEFPELGIMGDLLASTELNSKASVLVVKHQVTA